MINLLIWIKVQWNLIYWTCLHVEFKKRLNWICWICDLNWIDFGRSFCFLHWTLDKIFHFNKTFFRSISIKSKTTKRYMLWLIYLAPRSVAWKSYQSKQNKEVAGVISKVKCMKWWQIQQMFIEKLLFFFISYFNALFSL